MIDVLLSSSRLSPINSQSGTVSTALTTPPMIGAERHTGRDATVNTGYATIITPIGGEEHPEALKLFLRTEVEPLFDRDEPREILKCRPRFPFDRIGTLHFCSFKVLDG